MGIIVWSQSVICIVTGQLSSSEPAVATGRQILRMQQWWDEELELERDDLATLKRLTRVAMTQLTSGRTLHTQALVRNLRSHQRN